jgi:hypothetical protein
MEPAPASTLVRISLFAALGLLGLAALYAVWQFELLPLEPFATSTIAKITGARSPLVAPDLDPESETEQALAEASAAREHGSLALAVIHYRRALSMRRNSTEILRQLAACYGELGDTSAVAELRRVAPDAFDAKPSAATPEADPTPEEQN